MSTLIRGGVVVPVVPAGTVWYDGAVAFDDSGCITGVGPGHLFDPSAFRQVVDAHDRIIIPGLVNAHSHCLSNFQKGRLEKLPLELWRQFGKACWRHVSERDIYLAAMLGAIQMVRTGCTTVLDHFYAYPGAAIGRSVEHSGAGEVLKAWDDLGLRGVLAPMLINKRYEETVPLHAGQASAAGQAEIQRISRTESQLTLDDVRSLVNKYRGRFERITFFIGPGAPQRCTEELLQESIELATRENLGLHMHVAETRTQRHFGAQVFGKSLIRHLYDVGFLCDRLSMAHCVWVSDGDIELIRERGASVVHNPSSNLKLGSGIAPVLKMLRAGVNVALATDGASSNDSQNMFEAMKLGALLQCLQDVDFERWVSAQEALEMATIRGARACRLEATCGSLEPGKKADLVLLKRNHYSFVPLNNPVSQLVYCENGSAVDGVYVNGRVVLENGSLVHVNEQAIYAEVDEAMERLAPHFAQESANVEALQPALRDMYFEVMRAQQENGR